MRANLLPWHNLHIALEPVAEGSPGTTRKFSTICAARLRRVTSWHSTRSAGGSAYATPTVRLKIHPKDSNCCSFAFLTNILWLARAYHEGAGTERDLAKAYAHYTVAQQLGHKKAASELQKLDGYLEPAAKTTATQLAASISASLKPMPPAVVLQSPEADSAGPSRAARSPSAN